MNDRTQHPKPVPVASASTRYRRTSNTLDADLGEGKLAIMGLARSRYYTTNPVGRAMWEFLATPRTREEIRTHILATYDVTPEVCEKDVDAFLQDLLNEGLAETVSG